MQKILKSFLKKLTNLTGSNRSLLLLRLSEEQDLDLHELDCLNGKSSFQFIEDLIAEKKEIKICPVADSRSEAINKISKKLKKIDRREQFIFEERGSKDLYIGWPFVKGKFSNGNAVRCPLIFFPVELSSKDNQWIITLREGIPVSFNKSFFLAYAYYSGSSISDDFLDTPLNELDDDSKSFRSQLYNLLKESPVELNFNQDLFMDKLQYFEQYKKADYEEKFGEGKLKLFPEAVLGIFPQADSYLVPDYEVMIERSADGGMESFFAERNSSGAKMIREENTITPLPIDASQEQAIHLIKKGKSMVVQGPPGTGKSQLISNLIADYISRRKNVLLVCQKRAALDVVYERLNKLGLENFISLVHDYKNDRKRIFQQLNHQIENLEDYKAINNSLDSIYLERNFVQTCRRIEQLSNTLDEFKQALFSESECGISPKELYLTSDPDKFFVDLKLIYKNFDSEGITVFSRKLEAVIPYIHMMESLDFPWQDRVSFAGFSIADNKNIQKLLESLSGVLANYSKRFTPFLNSSFTDEINYYYQQQEKLVVLLELLESEEIFAIIKHILTEKKSIKKWLSNQHKKVNECFADRIELSLDKSLLRLTLDKLNKATQASSNILSWYPWILFSKDKKELQPIFNHHSIALKRSNLTEMKLRIERRLLLEETLAETEEKSILLLPVQRNRKLLDEWFAKHYKALNAMEILDELKTFKKNAVKPSASLEEFKNRTNDFITLINEYFSDRRKWNIYLTDEQLAILHKDSSFAEKLAESLRSHFEYLVAYDKLKEGFKPFEKETLQTLLDTSFIRENTVDIISVFQNSIRLSWLESLEEKYSVLRSVSTFEMEQMEKELQESCKLKEQISGQILLMNLREKTYKDIEYNRLDNRVTYRELQHQITKKKKVWPLRKVLSEFADEVFHLTPCWLASPEAVSSIFSMNVIFDLVIFDEASQCFSENGIPSIYRARQVLITGDSKQLPPSDLYSVRFEEEEELPELEVDSLLDLGKKYLSETTLTGHYRSKSLELIEFSNSNFYNQKLKVLPHFEDANKKEPAIRFIKVGGIWQNNVNIEEADKVVQLIKDLSISESFKSIAVVTFNYKQQLLIQDKLEEELGVVAQNVLVKNIENIQGDERDIIIFSLGYAPTAAGKLSMNFGSLNSAMGENRLNVAITRARERIYLIASILPHQLSVDELKNEGPRFLKEYLQYALEVSQGNFVSKKQQSKKSKDWYLKTRLMKECSFEMLEELPFADLTVKDRDKYKGLLLTDDELYYQSISSKEAHAYIPFSLKDKGWIYQRIYSRNYWNNSSTVLKAIESIN